jgi:hypothetical protein
MNDCLTKSDALCFTLGRKEGFEDNGISSRRFSYAIVNDFQ